MVDPSLMQAIERALDALPRPTEPFDVSGLDGFLCGVLVQPEAIDRAHWRRHVVDVEGRALPKGVDVRDLHALVDRRHAELAEAIARRDWFDPWVFELEGGTPAEAVAPWAAGFATALELFPALLESDAPELTEPLALIYRHLSTDDLEDAEELTAEIESLDPPETLAEAVEELVRACLLLADVAEGLRQLNER